MSLAQTNVAIRPRSQERRRFQRVRVNLLGRYMLSSQLEYPCQVINMSPGGLAVIAPVTGKPQERVIAYVDHVGRLEGIISRPLPNGFAMTITTTIRKRDKLAAQLTWLANRHLLSSPEDRRHTRIRPHNPKAQLILPNGLNIAVRVIDISQSGCAIATDQRPAIGTAVTIGKTNGHVVRYLDGGFAITFSRLLHQDLLEDSVTGG
jgi:hypothetical protein